MKFFFVIIFISFVYSLNNTFIGNNSNWFDNSNWSLNRIPISIDNVSIINKTVVAKNYNMYANNIVLKNSSLFINTKCYSNLHIDAKSILNLFKSNINGTIYNNGSTIINNKCNHTGNFYNNNSNIILKYASNLNIIGILYNNLVTIKFDSINNDHWIDASVISANKIFGNGTLLVKLNQINPDNVGFCWQILYSNHIHGNYTLSNKEYKNSYIHKYFSVWVCFNKYC